MKKKFEFEKLKIPNPDIWTFGETFNFSNSIFFVIFIFGFPFKKYFFAQNKHTFVLPKIVLD